MDIRLAEVKETPELAALVTLFRMELAQLRKKETQKDLQAARVELAEYQQKGYPIYVPETDQASLAGYLVCRVDGDVVWAESLFVLPEYRRQGIGSALYAEAEKLAEQLGSDTLYNWVDPVNEPIIRFLMKRGYNVLNLVELRRPAPTETLSTKVQVAGHEFDHY